MQSRWTVRDFELNTVGYCFVEIGSRGLVGFSVGSCVVSAATRLCCDSKSDLPRTLVWILLKRWHLTGLQRKCWGHKEGQGLGQVLGTYLS
jgi:hypothetical protein